MRGTAPMIEKIKLVVGDRKIGMLGLPGKHQSSENFVKKFGGVTYFTDLIKFSNNNTIYPLSEINKNFFLFIPEKRLCDEQFAQRLQSYGLEEGEDYFAMKHLPFAAGDGRNDLYGNVYEMKTKARIYFTGYNSRIVIEDDVKLPSDFSIVLGRNSSLHIGKNVVFRPRSLRLGNDIDFSIGESTKIVGMDVFINSCSSVSIGSRCTFQTGKLRTGRNQRIEIGNDIMASWDIIFLPHDGHLIWDVKSGQPLNNTAGHQKRSVVIEDHVWLGGECVLAENTHIGSGSIVAYRAFAKGKYPNNCAIGGLPAKVIKKDIAWTRANVTENEERDFGSIPMEWRRPTV